MADEKSGTTPVDDERQVNDRRRFLKGSRWAAAAPVMMTLFAASNVAAFASGETDLAPLPPAPPAPPS